VRIPHFLAFVGEYMPPPGPPGEEDFFPDTIHMGAGKIRKMERVQ
jgi:hypothetical protein